MSSRLGGKKNVSYRIDSPDVRDIRLPCGCTVTDSDHEYSSGKAESWRLSECDMGGVEGAGAKVTGRK